MAEQRKRGGRSKYLAICGVFEQDIFQMPTDLFSVLVRDDDEKIEFDVSDNKVDIFPTFEKMGLKENLLRGIYAYGKLLQRSSLIRTIFEV